MDKKVWTELNGEAAGSHLVRRSDGGRARQLIVGAFPGFVKIRPGGAPRNVPQSLNAGAAAVMMAARLSTRADTDPDASHKAHADCVRLCDAAAGSCPSANLVTYRLRGHFGRP